MASRRASGIKTYHFVVAWVLGHRLNCAAAVGGIKSIDTWSPLSDCNVSISLNLCFFCCSVMQIMVSCFAKTSHFDEYLCVKVCVFDRFGFEALAKFS